jgi:hypothetical protein
MNWRRPAVQGGLLLDLYSGASAAYSVKKLRASETTPGNLRGADNSTLVASFTGDDLNEAAITAAFGAQDVFFSSFRDQTGGGLDATQASASKQGRIAIGGTIQKQSSQPVMDAVGASLVEYVKTSQALSAYTVYLRVRITAQFTATINQGTEPFPYLHAFVGLGFRSGASNVTIGNSASTYGYANIAWVRTGSTGQLYINGVFIGQTTSLSTGNTTFTHVIGVVFGSGMTGQFRTMVVYPSAHDAATVAAINPLL